MSGSTPPASGAAGCASIADVAMPAAPKPAPAVPSPCIDVCAIDPHSGWCAGCLRTLDEIAAWGGLDNAGKRAVWKRLHERRAALAAQGPETGRGEAR
jgi:predicted Fe-S protein YdhL (DUF1289 family)